MSDPKRLIVLAWFVGLALIAAREIRAARQLPNPAAMVKASILYSILIVVGEFAAPFGAALAIGYTLALLMVPGVLPSVQSTVTNAGGTTPRAQGGQTALGSQ
jgi:hypothetical protein